MIFNIMDVKNFLSFFENSLKNSFKRPSTLGVALYVMFLVVYLAEDQSAENRQALLQMKEDVLMSRAVAKSYDLNQAEGLLTSLTFGKYLQDNFIVVYSKYLS